MSNSKRSFKKTKRVVLTGLVLLALVMGYFLYPPEPVDIEWPDGKSFAFTIVDDTDMSTLENVRAVYDLLDELDLRTTKTVWVLPTNDSTMPVNLGQTLADSAYADFVLDLQQKDFEIALHGARGGDSKRPEIEFALKRYHELLGEYPNIHINHFMNKDDLYWGASKLSVGPLRALYRLTGSTAVFSGDDPQSEYFWGDLLQEHVSYMVNFSFFEINLLNVNPSMPYHDPEKPYVNYWFHSSDGGLPETFNNLLSKRNLDRLEREGGACIVYTHFGKEFTREGALNQDTRRCLEDVASRNGWFVPASTMLDYLRDQYPDREQLSFRQEVRLELIWFWEKLLHGSS